MYITIRKTFEANNVHLTSMKLKTQNMNQQNIDKHKVIIIETSGLKHIDTTMIIGSFGLGQSLTYPQWTLSVLAGNTIVDIPLGMCVR